METEKDRGPTKKFAAGQLAAFGAPAAHTRLLHDADVTNEITNLAWG